MFSTRVNNLNPYVPGEQVEGNYIKLNANENPYDISQKTHNELLQFVQTKKNTFGLYPDPESLKLRKAIAHMLNESGGFLTSNSPLNFTIDENMIFCGNGSDEVLSFLFYSFFDSDKELVAPDLTYSFYPVYSDYYSIPLTKIPVKEDWTLDTEKMMSVDNFGGMIFANPNAPTGIALSVETIESMLENLASDKIMVVDEAYVDFSTQSALPLLQKYKNVVIVRTFSKSFSLAGMRLGYCIAHPEVISTIMKVKNSFNHFPVDTITQELGRLVCSDWNYYAQTAKTIIADRDAFSSALSAHGWQVLESKTNFVMVKNEAGISGLDIYEGLKKHSFLVRYFDNPRTKDWVRISIGKTEDMHSLTKIMCSNTF